jgi:hypothetical protein
MQWTVTRFRSANVVRVLGEEAMAVAPGMVVPSRGFWLNTTAPAARVLTAGAYTTYNNVSLETGCGLQFHIVVEDRTAVASQRTLLLWHLYGCSTALSMRLPVCPDGSSPVPTSVVANAFNATHALVQPNVPVAFDATTLLATVQIAERNPLAPLTGHEVDSLALSWSCPHPEE